MPDLNEFETEGGSVRFSVIGGSVIVVPECGGKTIQALCEQQGQPTTGMQATVNGRRKDFGYTLEGGEAVMIVQRVTGN